MRVCKECGTVAKPRSDTPGSILIELVLWLCFIVPGLIYSFWRISKRRQVCPACESPNIVPLDSPVGRALAGPTAAPPVYRGSPRAEKFGRSIGRLFAKKKSPR
jgi:hypothetical protein